ncbi:MAG: bifunctional (p)ppGpp synthetase/guanosine-3',5'-bis(diphosphate) 3'-pyrophosphohydrolase [Eubacteriales bacterium]|jgi:GTP pyrophosphokinase|nr:bifunctional (p)ppGpp synthetase/guanosine-3',5'-bis(diphosphate) 3'-pyrophosphohydrolase [Eubacteriales bacterium]MDD4104320.1 bifunctional (p)ppGpp synthetase/guanosine-3',5'-bis(diphosphate) 3'-pyrophosphohydrolase [Eubacteriales bacterium]
MAHSAFRALTLEEIIQSINRVRPGEDAAIIEKAYHFAANAHSGQMRRSGEPYFTHPVFVASILTEITMDMPTIAAGLLHDTVEDIEGISVEVIEREFGQEIAMLVDGVTKLGRLNFQDREEQQAESLRKMILAMGRDIRVVIIKLADRLHNMLTLGYQPSDRQAAIARETLDIYAPIAHRLGVYTIKQELEDLSLSYIDPQGYRDVAVKVGAKRLEREDQIKTIIAVLTEKLAEMGVQHFEIEGRPKHLYSIYRKMVIQNRNFDQIYDLIAVRVLVDTIPDCYTVLGVVHTLWNHMPLRFKDYISVPKNNMYQSLHTTLVGGRTIPTPFEVQIRTYDMHRVAEYGIAAHWNYKEGGTDKSMDKKLYWLRQILDWQSETKDSKEFIDGLKTDLFSEEVFLFTPKGDIVNMQRGATPLDFAYRIHSGVGNACTGAKVNGKIVPLDTELKTGDRVEILTSKTAKGPSMDWLKIVKTQQAKAKIRQFFKKELRGENIQIGREMLEREAKRRGVKLGDISKPESYEPLLKKYGFPDIEAIHGAVGYGVVPAIYVISQLLDEQRKETEGDAPKKPTLPEPHEIDRLGKPTNGIYVEGGSGMLVRFAHCCNPVPGDDIVGYITRGRGVTVHKADCVNAFNSEPERRVQVSWAKSDMGVFNASLRIIAYDHPSLLGEITVYVSDAGAPVTAVSVKVNKNGIVTIHMIVQVNSKEQLQQVLTKVRKRTDVIEAFRTAS